MGAIDPDIESIADQALEELVLPDQQGLLQALVGLGHPEPSSGPSPTYGCSRKGNTKKLPRKPEGSWVAYK